MINADINNVIIATLSYPKGYYASVIIQNKLNDVQERKEFTI